MGKIYIDQTALKIDLDADPDGTSNIDLTVGVSDVYIKYKKPNSDTVAQWDANVENTSHVTKVLSAGEIDTAGEWTFWISVEFSDSSEAPGEPSCVIIWERGT